MRNSKSYLIKKHQTYFVKVTLPQDVRPILGKTTIQKTTRTGDLALANKRKQPILQGIFELIEQARGGKTPNEYLPQYRMYVAEAKATGDPQDIVNLWCALHDDAVDIAEETGDTRALDAKAVAFGEKKLILEQLELYIANRIDFDGVDLKTVETEVNLLKFIANVHKHVEDLTDVAIEEWISGPDNMSLSLQTKKKKVSTLRQFMKFCEGGSSSDYFRNIPNQDNIPKKLRSTPKGEERKAFLPTDVVMLYNRVEGDNQLQDLIKLAAFTGCRISELTNLLKDNVHDAYLDITKAKTEAGVRQVPIHNKIRQLLARLLDESKGDYLLDGLNTDRHGDRSKTIGRRFSRKKTQWGFNNTYTFHSIRHTVITQMAHAGISELIIASIVGHEIPNATMSFGTYTKGATHNMMLDALEKVNYPTW